MDLQMTVRQLGILQAYLGSKASFENYVVTQKIPVDLRVEARWHWDLITAEKAANPGTVMMVPSD